MPKRRSSGPAKGAQSTLSFSNSSKISKASTQSKLKDQKIDSTPPSSIISSSKLESSQPQLQSSQPQPQIIEPAREKTKEEQKASKISDKEIRKYWNQREELRLAKRVHQKELRVEERILREWDCMSQFGPAIGISRTKRWLRAARLGLNPPIEVLAVLVKEEERDNEDVERAYIDKLMS